MTDEYAGSIADIEQREADALAGRPVSVAVAGPVGVQQMPSRSWSARNRTVPMDAGGIKIASADPRRRSLTLIAVNAPMFIGATSAANMGPTSVRWPAGVPLVLTHQEEVWAACTTADVLVSIVEELWAD